MPDSEPARPDDPSPLGRRSEAPAAERTPRNLPQSEASPPLLDEVNDRRNELETQTDASRQEQAQLARLRERDYQTLAENLPGLAYRIHLRENRRMEFFNRLVEDMTGYAPDELVMGAVCSIEPLIVEEDRQGVVDIVRRALRDRRSFTAAYRITHRDGTIRHFEEWGRPICGEDGRPLYVDGVILDVTDREVARDAQRRQQTFLESVMRTTDVLLVLLDAQFNFVWVNRAYADSCRMRPEEMVGKNHFALYPDAENEAIFRKVRDTGEGVFYRDKPFTFPDQPKRGITYWNWSLSPVRDAGGQVTNLVFSLRETTEFQRAVAALRSSESRYRELVHFANSAIIRWSRDGTITFFNEYAEKFFGWRADEAVGRPIGILLPDEDSSGGDQKGLVGGIVDQPDRYVTFVNENVCRDGRRVWMAWTNRAIRNARGEVTEVLAVGTDITERKRAEEGLRRLNETLEAQVTERTAVAERRARDLRRLAAELSETEHRERTRLAKLLHDDLQQLLLAVNLRLPLLVEQDRSQLEQRVGEVGRLVGECMRTARNLTQELSPPILQVGTLPEVLGWLGRSFDEKHGLKVAVEIEGECPPVPEHLRVFIFQAVCELLVNVVKHSGKRHARLGLSARGGYLTVQVEDEGERFDPEAVELRLDRPDTLGLFNIQQRLEALGGWLDIEGTDRGGACFRLVVPVAEDTAPRPEDAATAPAAARAGAARRPRAGADAIRLLVVDDHAVVREGFAGLFSREPDFEIVGEAADGEQAVRQVEALHPDAILMDVNMPRMGGVEATRRIRQRHPATVIVGLSIHEDEAVARAMFAAGAHAYVSKHVPAKDVVEAVRQAARREAGVEAGVE
jgi:PAS domain S-box-containing protein